MKAHAGMAALGEQEHEAGDPPPGVTEHRREPGVYAGTRRLAHRSTFTNLIAPSNFGIVAMCAGEVSTCAERFPGCGGNSRHSTTSVLPSSFVPVTSTEYPADGRVPRKTATTVRLLKSTAGAGAAPLCARHSAAHSGWVFATACRASSTALMLSRTIVATAPGCCAVLMTIASSNAIMVVVPAAARHGRP